MLIGHPQESARTGYRALLQDDDRIEVVAEASSSQQALELSAWSRPHVALLDLELAGFDDAEATARTVAHPALARVAVILIAPACDDARVYGAVLAGAVGVVQQDVGPNELIGAVRVVARGGAFLPAPLVRRLLEQLSTKTPLTRPAPAKLRELTPREREIVALVAKGLSNSEIASLLVVSPNTAKTHVSRAMVKLGARHRAQLVVLAYETGLVVPPPFEDSAPRFA